MITATELSRSFGATRAVDGLSLQVERGEIFGLVGPDGAGKTTTMRLLTGILAPTSGHAVVAGCDVQKEAEKLKQHVGYMSQRFGLYADLTVLENIHFYADIYGVPRRTFAGRLAALLAFSNLTPFQHRLAGNLSGGMKQKLGLACALIHTPKVLFLDEPTNGVDPVSRRDFWRILYQLVRDGVTLFVSTAYLDEAERCTRLALIDHGRVLGLGTPAEVKRLMAGALYEVRSANPRAMAAALREQLSEATVGLFGDRVHVALPEPGSSRWRSPLHPDGDRRDHEAERQIRAAATAAGIEITALAPIQPSLEDVFVSVLAGSVPANPTPP